MKKFISIALFLATAVAMAAPTPFKVPNDTLQWGQGGSSANKCAVNDFGLGASNPAVCVDSATKTHNYNYNQMQLGDGTTSLKKIIVNTGSVNLPFISYNNVASSWQFSNDGLTTSNFGSGSGGGSSLGVEFLEQKSENEHYGLITDPIDNSVSSGFAQAPSSYYINGVLIDTLTATNTSMKVVWAPLTLSSTDKNTDTTTGWTAEGAATTLATSVTAKVGTASLSFNKAGTGTSATIKYDATAANLGVNGFTALWFWINLPSTANLTDVTAVIDIDATNKQTFTTTTDYAGNPLAVGWNLIKIDVSTGGTAGGTGWLPSQAFRYFHVGVDAGSAQVYTGILIDAIYFEIVNPSNYVPVGTALTIYDTSNREELIVDSSNTVVDGGAVTLASAIGHTYTGGFGGNNAVISRSSLAVGSNQAAMTLTDQFVNPLSGNIQTTQEVRLARALRSSLSSATLNAFAEVNTSQVYQVFSTTSTQIVVIDSTDDHLNLLSGDVVHVFQTKYVDGKANFIYRGDFTLSANSSALSGHTTLTCTGVSCVPTGTVAGDYVVKKHVTASLSAATLAANESFTTLSPVASPDGMLLYDTGIPIPNLANLFGYWALGGLTTSQAVKLQSGTATALTLTGTLTPNFGFFDGFGTIGWSAANYYSMSAADAATVDGPATLAVSLWFYPTSSLAGDSFLIAKSNGSTTGWGSYLHAATTSVSLQINGANSIGPTGTYVNNQWNHVYFDYQRGVAGGTRLFLNGVNIGTATTSETASGSVMYVSNQNTLNSLASNVSEAQLMVWTGQPLSTTQISQIYNNGRARIMGFGPELKYRYQATSVSGQKVSLKAQLQRSTTAVAPFLRKIGISK